MSLVVSHSLYRISIDVDRSELDREHIEYFYEPYPIRLRNKVDLTLFHNYFKNQDDMKITALVNGVNQTITKQQTLHSESRLIIISCRVKFHPENHKNSHAFTFKSPENTNYIGRIGAAAFVTGSAIWMYRISPRLLLAAIAGGGIAFGIFMSYLLWQVYQMDRDYARNESDDD